ncbi:MAG: hypothetical protein ABI806_08960 [Candidatus Solibacter sp.]
MKTAAEFDFAQAQDSGGVEPAAASAFFSCLRQPGAGCPFAISLFPRRGP